MFNAPALAERDFDEALALRPEYPDALLGRADVRIKQGKVREALASVEEALRHGEETPRSLYNAARVHAQAVARLLNEPAGQQPDWRTLTRCEERAVELLGQALARTPAGEREAFWRRYVQADAALNSLRQRPGLRALAETFAPAPR
jgi:hypothetical protein